MSGLQRAAALPVDGAAIARAAALLRAGGLVAFPTETVYGLGADARNPAAVARIFAAKGRPADHPVIVHVEGPAALARWARAVPAWAQALAQRHWPGPLTLVLPRSALAHDGLTGGQGSVGLRCPAHPWARALLAAFCAGAADCGIAAPSANRFGRISPTTAQHVRDDLGEGVGGAVDFVLDGGPCPVGIESTIVDATAAAPRLLRPGAITRAQLEAELGQPVPDAAVGAPRASGRLDSHYAPRTPTELVAPAALVARLAALADERLAVLARQAVPAPRPAQVICWRLAPQHPAAYARDLYAALRALDASGATRLLIETPPAGPAWEAVRDRLGRAAATPGAAGSAAGL